MGEVDLDRSLVLMGVPMGFGLASLSLALKSYSPMFPYVMKGMVIELFDPSLVLVDCMLWSFGMSFIAWALFAVLVKIGVLD